MGPCHQDYSRGEIEAIQGLSPLAEGAEETRREPEDWPHPPLKIPAGHAHVLYQKEKRDLMAGSGLPGPKFSNHQE